MKFLSCLLLFCGLFAAAPQEAPTPEPSPPLVIHAGAVWTGNAVLRDRIVVVQDGRIMAILPRGAGPLPSGARVIDASGGWVLPGLVLAGGGGLVPIQAEEHAITPGMVAADAFDPFSPYARSVRSGLLTAWLTPGTERLVPGQGSIVRLGREDPSRAVLMRRAGLQVVLAESSRNPPAIFVPTVPPGPDNPISPPRPQFPATRSGAMLALRELFDAAREAGGEAPRAADLPDLRPVQDVVQKREPLRIVADRAVDIRHAVELAEEYGFALIIEGGTEAGAVAQDLARIGAAVVLRSGTAPTSKLPPPEPFFAPDGRPDPDTAAILAKAGVKLALMPPPGGAPEDLAWFASASLAPGFDRQAVLRAITSEAADLLGVGAQCGRLAVGRSADLFVIEGEDPLAAAARPALVVSAGRVVHDLTRTEDGDLRPVAITVGRIHTADGDPLEDATILVVAGKIVGLGPDLTVPAGARRIHLPEASVIPGLIDSGGQVGIRGYKELGDGEIAPGAPLPALGTDTPPARMFDPSFPDVRAAALSGVTSVVLSPMGGKPVSGVLSVVKTGGRPNQESVVSEAHGIYFDYAKAKWAPNLADGLRKTLAQGKKYSEEWDKYGKALAEWRRKHPDADAGAGLRRVRPEVTAPAVFDPISGTWTGRTLREDGRVDVVEAELTLADGAVKGSAVLGGPGHAPIEVSGTFAEGEARVEASVEEQRVRIVLWVGREEMRGSWSVGEGLGGWIDLRRIARPAAPGPEPEKKKTDDKQPEAGKQEGNGEGGKSKQEPAKGKDAEKPKEESKDETAPAAPKIVAALEPYRAVFGYKAAIFIGVPKGRLGRELLDIARGEFDVITVVIGERDVESLVPRIVETSSALSTSAASIGWVDGAWINPPLLAVRGRAPVLLRSGSDGDTRTLLAAAGYAVRHGLDPEAALNAMTRWPAMVLGLDDRIGLLKVGRDADLVILSGEPFTPGVRVLKVMVDGRFVDEEKP